jgi:hypothetical protein
MSEEWRTIPGYEGRYEVSSLGRVRTISTFYVTRDGHKKAMRPRLRKLAVGPTGYPSVRLSDGSGRGRNWKTCQLVARAFLGVPDTPGLEVCHNDGDKLNNRIENLRWDTHAANVADMMRHGSHFWAKRTHCKYGHEYTPENTRIRVGTQHTRICRACAKAESRARYLASLEREEAAS